MARKNNSILPSEGQLILRHTATFFNLIFVVMATLLMLSGSTIIKLSFLVVVIINTVISCVQSIRAKRAVEKLTLIAEQTLPVTRNGQALLLPTSQLLPGDLVTFSAGNQISADGILETGQLLVNESLITGEEDAIPKNPGDQLLSGSFVVAGSGTAQLTHVGSDAYAGRLTRQVKENHHAKKSEMMRSLDKLIRIIGILLIPVGILLFCHEHFVLGREARIGVESTTAALVGMIPEGLYLLTSIALAASSVILSKKQVLVRDTGCIETLARVDVLCLDKTGTITEPGLEVEQVIPLEGDPTRILTAIATARPPENETAKALLDRFRGETDWNCLCYTPFTSQRKYSAWTFEGQGTFLLGAPDVLLGGKYPDFQPLVTPHTQNGLRVLLVAHEDKTPIALLLLRSRIRKDAPDTIAYFKNQGVQIKVISGDDPQTAAAIAQRAGIENAQNWVDATKLQAEEDLTAAAPKYTVFGRVTPEQKRALLRALKEKGHTVAMTGDGVNDILAMREADCAIAMASGAQAASQVAHLVLLQSDFAAMPHILLEGRRVINNIQRAATLFLVKNIFSLGITLLTLLLNLPYPMEPQHVTVISGLTIGIPAFFLALEPNYQRVTGRFLPSVIRKALTGGLTDVLAVLLLHIVLLRFGIPSRQISTLCTVVLATTGLLVLWQVSRPFAKFRRLVWLAMVVGLIGCFTLLGGIFEFQFSPMTLTLIPIVIAATAALFLLLHKLQQLFIKP